MSRRIGIIGSGNMGRAIGVRLAQLGNEVMFGARQLHKAEAAARIAGHGERSGSNDEAAAHGDVLVWTTRETDPAVVLSDPALLDGKVVIDLNNRDYAQDVREGAWFGSAIAEALQASAPGARVVKAFNVIAQETFGTSPEALRTANAQVFIAGDDSDAKQTVSELARSLGFEAVDLGAGPVAMRAAEALGDVIRLLIIDQRWGMRANLQLHLLPEQDLPGIGSRLESLYH